MFKTNKLIKNIVKLSIVLFLGIYFTNAQTFVTVYSEDFETVADGTQIGDIGFTFWGNNSTITESTGNGANNSNRFVTTSNTTSSAGIIRKIALINGKEYKYNVSVKTASSFNHNPLRITRPSGAGNYFNRGQILGTNNWETYSTSFTALATEEVDFVTVKVNSGELNYDNIKLEIEGIAWTGAFSTNWHDARNWEGNQIPSADDHVLIANVTKKPIISDAEVKVTSLEIADGTKLLVQNNKPLIVNGQLTGNTGFVELLAGSTLFAQRVVGGNHIIPEEGTFSINTVFQSNMVLQRDRTIPIYGAASNGLSVTVEFAGQTKTATSANGKWQVDLDPVVAGGPYTLKISGIDTFEYQDILMGDVWICGGQSNMAKKVQGFIDLGYSEFTNEPGTYQNNQIRLMRPRVYEANEVQDNVQFEANWQAATTASIKQFSATGYFFGKYLHQEISVPIGLVNVARGGTGMGSFVPLETVNANPNIKDKYDYSANGLSDPSTLYNSMIHPLIKQPVKGVIWYQGEAEAIQLEDRTTFSSIFTDLITSWRTAWNQNDMPFIFTQLSAWAKQSSLPVESNIAIVRNQQLKTWKTVANTGMVVSIDGGVNGGIDDIHPPNKEDVGSRLALFARKLVYGENIVHTGPKIKEAVRITQTDKAILKFKHFGQGLEAKADTLNTNGSEKFILKKDTLYSFELAGSDNIFHKAIATIANDSIIAVTSANVPEPVKVRYGWNNFPLTNLFNETDLPASPFEIEVNTVSSDNSISNGQLTTYNAIPGRNESDQYICRVKLASEPDSAYRDVFELQTTAKDDGDGAQGNYFDHLEGWSASWIAFESDFNDNVIVEIAKKDGSAINKAMVRPVGDASPATITNGKAYVTFTEPANINVDINGQLEDQYTGHGYSGSAIHTISLFANPIFEIPDVNNPQVRVLQPNEDLRTLDRNTWQTIIFAPGVHNIGMEFQILDNETLFIPGDAILQGTIHPIDAFQDEASQFFKVYGSGTISGENITREITSQVVNGETIYSKSQDKKYKPFTNRAEGAHLEGFVVADPAFHTFNMGHSKGGTANPNIYKNLKVLAWRVNSDGINAFRNSEVSDCFFRVQDDAFYLGSENVNQHDNVVWNDANGAVLFLQNIVDGSTNTFRDVKVIYHRAYWHWWTGGRIVSMRETSPGVDINNVHIKNILVEDPKPAFAPFYFRNNPEDTNNSGPSNFSNIIIENVRQEHPAVIATSGPTGENLQSKNYIEGNRENATIGNIWFKNCHYAGTDLTSLQDGDFELADDFVDQNTIVFTQNATSKTFDGEVNSSWNIANNWSDNSLPNNNENVIIPPGKNVTISSSTTAEVKDLIVQESGSLSISDGGNLMLSGASFGEITYHKTLNTNNWYLMSPPVKGVIFNDTFINDNNIASGTNSNVGIATYSSLNNWSYLQAGSSLASVSGLGYSIKKSSAGNVSFTGTINNSDVAVNVNLGFNLLGNPYATSLNSASFLVDNSENLVSQTLWLFNQSTGNYETKVTVDNFKLAPGQGFFINANTPLNSPGDGFNEAPSNTNKLVFAKSYQTTGGIFQKAEKTEIILNINDGEKSRFSKLFYLENATLGFDNGLDGETFAFQTNNLDIYTELLEDNKGKKYQIQSLPDSNFENTIVPVGLVADKNATITFSIEANNLPTDVKVYLEDREKNLFVRLDKAESNYQISLNNTSDSVGRFFLHTKRAVLSANTLDLSSISIYPIDKKILRVKGIDSEDVFIQIYNTLGKKLLENSYKSKEIIDVNLPILSSGIYIVDILTNEGKISKKIVLQ